MTVEMLRLKTLGIGMMSPCLDDSTPHGDRQFQPGDSAPFMVRRPEEKDARTRIWLEHGDTLVIDGLAQEGVRSCGCPCAGRDTNKLYIPAAGTTPSKVYSFCTVVLAAILHSRFVRVGPPLGSGRQHRCSFLLRFSHSERRCRNSQRTLLLHKSLFKGTSSLDWEYACSVRPGTPPNELFFI